VKKILEAERSGFDAIVQSNTFDPGVEAGRLAVRIPVVGVLRSSCHFAACLCDRFGVIVPYDSYVPYVWRLMETYRVEHLVSDINALNISESEITTHRALVVDRIIALGQAMVARGAQAIIPLGGNFVPKEISPDELESKLGVPIINTNAVGIRFAEIMVITKNSHSQKAYPWAPGLTPEAIVKRSTTTLS
jgi:Asp/Glu/hydantoin racemase